MGLVDFAFDGPVGRVVPGVAYDLLAESNSGRGRGVKNSGQYSRSDTLWNWKQAASPVFESLGSISKWPVVIRVRRFP